MSRNAIHSDRVARPVGPFSPAVQSGEFLYLSGQVALDPATGRLIEGDTEAQAERILANLEHVLQAAGRGLGDVVRVGLFLTSMEDFAAVNAVFTRRFEPPFPARTTVGVASLPLGARVEIDAIAR
jgi:2-iminobutanoate/2-iminopropanoate deaminase